MKKIEMFLVLFMLSSSLFSQQFISKKYDSKEIGATRDLKIYLPKGYKKDSVSNYPLAIVIDNEYLFDIYVANSKLFSIADKAPKQIVVGISIHKTREEDTFLDEKTHQLTRGNIKFLKFIRNEVLPYMEGSYRTSPFVTLVGHGAAANIVTALLRDKKPVFNAYIAINPLFPKNITQKVTAYQVDRLGGKDNTYYYYVNELPFFSKENKKTLARLKTYLSSINAKNFHFKYDKMNSPNYISAVSEAVPRFMNKIFELYAGITKEEFNEKIKNLEPLEAISYLENKYLDIDFLFGSDLGIREKDIYTIEDVIIDKENGEYLRDFGEMILNVYPKSHIGNYYVGLWYEKRNKKAMALDSYRRGYGKMKNSDPNKKLFYSNIERVNRS